MSKLSIIVLFSGFISLSVNSYASEFPAKLELEFEDADYSEEYCNEFNDAMTARFQRLYQFQKTDNIKKSDYELQKQILQWHRISTIARKCKLPNKVALSQDSIDIDTKEVEDRRQQRDRAEKDRVEKAKKAFEKIAEESEKQRLLRKQEQLFNTVEIATEPAECAIQ